MATISSFFDLVSKISSWLIEFEIGNIIICRQPKSLIYFCKLQRILLLYYFLRENWKVRSIHQNIFEYEIYNAEEWFLFTDVSSSQCFPVTACVNLYTCLPIMMNSCRLPVHERKSGVGWYTKLRLLPMWSESIVPSKRVRSEIASEFALSICWNRPVKKLWSLPVPL